MNSTQPDGCPARDPRFPAVWPQHMLPVNVLLFVLEILFVIGGSSLLIYHRKKPFIFERGYILQLLLGLALIFQSIIVFLRDAIGRDVFPCDAYLWLSSLTAPLFCSSIWIRLVVYHNKVTFAASRAKANLEVLNDHIIEHKRLRDIKGEMTSSGSQLANSARKLVQKFNPQPIVMAAAYTIRKRVTPPHEGTHIIKMHDLTKAKALTGEGFAFIVMSAIMLPFLVTIGYRYKEVSFYGHGCVGCILGLQETWIFFGAIIIILVFGFMAVVYWRLYQDPDPLWILREIFWSSVLATIFTIPAIVVDLINPQNIHTNGIISWGYLITFGMTGAFGIQTYYIVRHTFLLDRRRKCSATSVSSLNTNLTFDDVLTNPMLRQAFSDHLISEFSIENLKFYDQVTSWEKSFPASTDKARRHGAMAIYRAFLEPTSAPLEVNISSSQRDPLVKIFSALEDELAVDIAMFATTKREIYKLMSTDSFNRFKVTSRYLTLVNDIQGNQQIQHMDSLPSV